MSENIKILAERAENKTILESLLQSRGIFNIQEFLEPEKKPLFDPYAFSDMEKAVNIIKNAIENNEHILIWGDFDADGVTSTSILCKALDALGADYSYFLPDRINLGHGINLKKLLVLKSQNKFKVMITVDCGISNVKEIELIKTMGVKIILTDHHQPPETLPMADCILNPLAENSLKNTLEVADIEKISCLSGAGVALKLAYALLGDGFDEAKNQILVLGAVGTISDVVPLVGENRIITAKGLQQINNNAHKGISMLFQAQNINRKITSEDVAFILSPRINAAGRLDVPDTSIKLLIDNNLSVIDMTIKKLDSLNKVRQNLCETIFEEALAMVNNTADCIVLYNSSWHLGIIGIVASRLVERFNVPVFLISKDDNDLFRASVRGIAGYDIAKILKHLESHFVGYGGHSMAGGFSADPNCIDIDTLTNLIIDAVKNFGVQNPVETFQEIDMELNGSDVSIDLINELDKMEPFGAANKRPLFLFKQATLVSKKIIGKEYNHMVFNVLKDNAEFNCVFWKRKTLDFSEGEKLDFIFRPEINYFNSEAAIRLSTEAILNDNSYEKNCPLKFFDHRQKTGILQKIDSYVAQKDGQVKVWATTIATRKKIECYSALKQNLLTKITTQQKSVMLFDFPPSVEKFKEIIKTAKPHALHLMNADYIKSPDECICFVCGMLKYASNQKKGIVDFESMANSAGLDEVCMSKIITLLESIGCISSRSTGKIKFIAPPGKEALHHSPNYWEFYKEFRRIASFKKYFKTASTDDLKQLCLN